MIQNVLRALRLDRDLYESVERDSSFNLQALTIVVITGFIAGVRGWYGPPEGSVQSAVAAVVADIIGWLIWALVTLVIGTRLFQGSSDFGQMARVLGFASAPRAFFIIPWVGVLVGGVWMLAAGFVAVRQGLDLDGVRALATIILGLIPAALLYLVVTGIVL